MHIFWILELLLKAMNIKCHPSDQLARNDYWWYESTSLEAFISSSFFWSSSHIDLGLDGVEIIVNSSGSYSELRKAYVHVEMIKSATARSGGCYVFSNLRGCDGQRVYFNSCACIALNGFIVSKTKQYALEEVVWYQSNISSQQRMHASLFSFLNGILYTKFSFLYWPV